MNVPRTSRYRDLTVVDDLLRERVSRTIRKQTTEDEARGLCCSPDEGESIPYNESFS